MAAPDQALKALIPGPLRRRLQTWRRNRALGRTLRACQAAIALDQVPAPDLLQDLVRVWGNPHWSADVRYLHGVIHHALTTTGPYLECGSGLTTLLLGAVARHRRTTVWSLEHLAPWRDRLLNQVERLGLLPVTRVLLVELRSTGEGFHWYAPDLSAMPTDFSLVICDGPPGDTPGGRYGAVPVMARNLASGAIILLDDASRPGEQDVIHRWQREFAVETVSAVEASQRFAVLRMPHPHEKR